MLRPGKTSFLVLALLSLTTAVPALELEDCRISAGEAFPSLKARCGTLSRPENPEDPDSPRITLRVAVVPALNLEPMPDPVVPIAGGPGQGAVEFYAGTSGAFEHLRRDRDILLVDQRGTGESSRLSCPTDDDLADSTLSTEEIVAYSTDCLEALPHDPRYFTTSVAVGDLEAVRAALGYPALNLYGISYGSRVAQHYARRYPSTTRTVVLDGVVPPQLPLGPEIATESQAAIDRIFARCAEDPDCNERFPDLSARFAALRAQLERRPVRVKSANPVTGAFDTVTFGNAELAAALRLMAYNARTIALVPLLVHEAANGNYRPLVAHFQMNTVAIADAMALGMHNAVMCSEDVPFYSDDLIDDAALAESYMGPLQLEALEAICSAWPAGVVDPDLHTPLATDAPVLLLSGDADPITPPRYADMAAINLKKAWLLTGHHQGHGQITVGCMPRLVAEFVNAADLTDVDTACMEKNFVMPFFLDYGGPAP